MRALIAASPLVILVKISIAWTIDSSTCGRLPVHNVPHLTHSKLTHRWPWHAAIFHRQFESEPTYECGGTVISRDWILTAAHCVSTESRDIVVALGRLNLAADETRTEQSFNVTTIVIHERYDPTHYENDIALVQLSHTAIFNNFVRAICLWSPNRTELYHLTNKLGTVVGWGRTEKFEMSNVLQEAHFEVVSHITCQVTNRDFYVFYLTQTNFCAGLRNGTSVCTGDSGGSMTFEQDGSYYVRGIVSTSPSKINYTTQQLECDTMEYAIYTDVAMYLQWIADKTGIENAGIEKTGIECQAVVRCAIMFNQRGEVECNVDVYPTQTMCKIFFDESSSSIIKSLSIIGEFESIPDLSDAVTKFENLRTLRLNNTKLKFVDRVRLTAFRRLDELDLSDNEISHLEADTFGDLKELRALRLNNNTILELPVDIFEDLYNLRLIQLHNNKLPSLPQGLFRDNKQLLLIELNGNHLKELHVDLFKGLNFLEKLLLFENQIDNLPPGLFRDNQQLQGIHPFKNTLKHLHVDTFKGLNHLQNIILSENQIDDLPPGLFRDNQQLLILHLFRNHLKELHVDTFKGLNHLEYLALSENQIDDLPPSLFRDNQQLLILHLFRNHLKELHVDTFKGLNHLEYLALSENQIDDLPPSLFRDNKQLRVIHLFRNHLKELHVDTFKGLNHLTTLVLFKNQIDNLPPGLFRDNQQLRVIQLENNRIKKIESDFSYLSKLRVLRLRENVCIDEDFLEFDSYEINNKIRTKCSN